MSPPSARLFCVTLRPPEGRSSLLAPPDDPLETAIVQRIAVRRLQGRHPVPHGIGSLPRFREE